MKQVSILFLLLFVAFMITPTVVAIIGDESHLSIVLCVTEEEQNKEERNFSENHIKILNKQHNFSVVPVNSIKNNLTFHNKKNWSSVYFDILNPPPEHTLS